MKKLLLIIGLTILTAYTLEASVLQRNIEESPIEVPTSFVTEVEIVEEYETGNVKKKESEYRDERPVSVVKKDTKANVEILTQVNDMIMQVVQKQESIVVRSVMKIEKKVSKSAFYPSETDKLFISASLGYGNTSYDKLDTELDNGVLRSEFSLMKYLDVQNAVGIALSFIHPTSHYLVVENTTMSVVKPYFQRIHFLSDRLSKK